MIHLTFNDTPLKYNNDWIGNHNPVVNTSAFFISGTYGARDGASAMGEAKTPLITYVSGIPSADVAVNTTVINGHVNDILNTSAEPPEVKWTFSNFTNGKTFKPNIYVKDAMYSAKISLYSFYTARTDFKLYTAADSAYPEITNGGSAMNSPSGSIVTLQPTNNALGYYGGLNFKYYLDHVQFPSATNNFNSPFGILLECTAQPTNGAYRIIESGNWILSGHLAEPPQPPVPTKLTIDLNNVGNERTSDFQTQTRYPNVWSGMRVFETNSGVTAGETYHDFIRNLGNLSSNFTIYYWFAAHYNSTSYEYGQVKYTTDNTDLIAKQGGWTYAGQDSQQPWYDKSRYRTVTVDVSKSGDLDFLFHYDYDGWYGSRIYFAIDENLISDVINPKQV